jgi:hypothetical protein
MLFLGIGTKEGGWSPEQNANVTGFFLHCNGVVLLGYGEFPGPAPLINVALEGLCNIEEILLYSVPDIDGFVLALGNNNSLLRLTFWDTIISDDNWTALCQSLARNSTLVHLCLHRTFLHELAGPSGVRKVLRTSAFLQMLRFNTALQELDARDGNSDPPG